VALGLVLFSLLGVDSSVWVVYGPILFLATGMALTMTPLTTQIMAAVPVTKAGVGSAMNDTTRELGGALGVAVLGSLVTSTYASSLGDAVSGLSGADRAAAESGLVGAFGVAQQLGAEGAGLVEAAKQAFVDGMGVASITGAVVVAIAAVLSYRLLPHGPGAVPARDDDAPEVAASDEAFALAD
jgi:DHA2 family integral membrane protein (MFS transporter)